MDPLVARLLLLLQDGLQEVVVQVQHEFGRLGAVVFFLVFYHFTALS